MQKVNAEYEPKFLRSLRTGGLIKKVEALEKLLESCTVCPKDCGNNRLKDEIAACYSGRLPIVSSYTPHFGEEPVLSGTNGAGNIFFGNCNLRCVYCQNYQISQTHKTQKKNEITHERLAEMMLELQAKGCHNIAFVSPTHFAPQMARAILIAAENGLKIPIVYNTNAYDSVEVLKLLDGIIDIYLPDFKYADNDAGFQFSKVRGYTDFARQALLEMFRQTGDQLIYGADGLLKRGLVIRLLVLPNDIAGIEENLIWIKENLSPKTAISLMAQYYATNKAATDDRYILLSRRISEREWSKTIEILEDLQMEEGFLQEYESASYYYRPDFADKDKPFKDIRDFKN
ncbi:MAG: radical SAM protein [Pyrinomonadaceae bacterium]